MKHILLLTDFSKNSKNAINYAMELFHNDSCEFYLLHIQKVASYSTSDLISSGTTSVYNAIVKKSKNKLEQLVATLEDDYANTKHNFQTLVDYDTFIDAIHQAIKTHAIDLIIMGTNGATGATETIFGSNTIHVIRKIDCPTLVIPEGFKYKQPKEILLPLDPFDSLKCRSFQDVVAFTKRFSEKFHLLRIVPNKADFKDEKSDQAYIADTLENRPYKYHIITHVPMNYVVDCYTQTHTIDLIALLVQKESFLERFFTASSTSKISNKVKVPLLILHT